MLVDVVARDDGSAGHSDESPGLPAELDLAQPFVKLSGDLPRNGGVFRRMGKPRADLNLVEDIAGGKGIDASLIIILI